MEKKDPHADWPYEAKVWRYALLAAAKDAEQAILSPPKRRQGESLKVFVTRSQKPLQDAMQRWEIANATMHAALQAAGKRP